jgi:hypothetical protein
MKRSFTLSVIFFISLALCAQTNHKKRTTAKSEDVCTACINPSFVSTPSTGEEDDDDDFEQYGGALNVGFGMGYYPYITGVFPMIHINYEFDVARNLTLAPFISIYSYRNFIRTGNSDFPSNYYYYRRSVIPVGVKGSYYFDELLGAGPKWDFYGGASLGVTISKTTWDNGYMTTQQINRGIDPLFLNIHAGTKYHLNNSSAVFFEMSPEMSTLGMTFYLE